ncbi:MAG: DUF3617 family protein [Sphingomonas sp.]|uniref:DUF3617 domain-containing protein n=1 Tax=Sphingomonas sp. TaxID=28214 RepID=UPI001AC27ED2|nr:DUF3617 family protein [Sphingomonas sp.]MBN8808194.1 DUF3617 family protein [Sphingomonas sp.]
MRTLTIAAAAAATLLAGCAKPGPPPKPQPGSWSMKMELVDAQGPDADKVKAMMGPMFASMSNMSICITPEASAKSDPTKGITQGGDCKFDRQEVNSSGIHVSGVCTKNGTQSKVTADGSITATSQDLTMQTETTPPGGKAPMSMKLRMQMQRTGDCKPGDITPPAGSGPM